MATITREMVLAAEQAYASLSVDCDRHQFIARHITNELCEWFESQPRGPIRWVATAPDDDPPYGDIVTGVDGFHDFSVLATCIDKPIGEMICNDVNAYDDLVAAVKTIQRIVKHWEGRDGGAQWYADLQAALARCEGKVSL